MTKLFFHHDTKILNKYQNSNDLVKVQLYGRDNFDKNISSAIGQPVLEPLKRLGIKIPNYIFDFLTISMAVTAADTFIQRDEAEDGWARHFDITLPLSEPKKWTPFCDRLQRALHFLSGDTWKFSFVSGGMKPPKPYNSRYKLIQIKNRDCVCLFSGGLDSCIGAIDLISQGRKPILTSHGYKGDAGYQGAIKNELGNNISHLSLNADPHGINVHDNTMRSRSFNFLAFGALAASAINQVSGKDKIDLFIPENGLISLNIPLTPRRIGTHSTRTTHPYYIASIQELFDDVGIPANIINPYQFLTKGEMAKNCKNTQLLSQVTRYTVSCSNWKRKNKQCGRCIPCIIRRASLSYAKIPDTNNYETHDLSNILENAGLRDDLMSFMAATRRISSSNIDIYIKNSGPLPPDKSTRNKFSDVYMRGLKEVKSYLLSQGLS